MVSFKRAALAVCMMSMLAACSTRIVDNESASPDAVPMAEAAATNTDDMTAQTQPTPEPGADTAAEAAAFTGAPSSVEEAPAPAPAPKRHVAKHKKSSKHHGKTVAVKKSHKKSTHHIAAHKAKRKKIAHEAVATAQIDSGTPPAPPQNPPAVTATETPAVAAPADTSAAAALLPAPVETAQQMPLPGGANWTLWWLIAGAAGVVVLLYKQYRAKQARRLVYTGGR